ncbi:transcriptional regulator, partial [Corallococcus llansteffanensis]
SQAQPKAKSADKAPGAKSIGRKKAAAAPAPAAKGAKATKKAASKKTLGRKKTAPGA